MEFKKEAERMSIITGVKRDYRIGGYVKRAKLNLRNERESRVFHQNELHPIC